MKNMRMETIAMAIAVENRRGEGRRSGRYLPQSPSSPSSPPSGGLPPPPPPPRESSMMSSMSGGAIVPGMLKLLFRLSSLVCLGHAIRGNVLRNEIFGHSGNVKFVRAAKNDRLAIANVLHRS